MTCSYKEIKIFGLYDPEENGFDLEMWNNTEPNKIFELSKKINNMTLSEDAKNIYTKLLLTNSYSPKDEIDEKIFLDIKSDWLIKFKDVDLNPLLSGDLIELIPMPVIKYLLFLYSIIS